MVSSSVPDYNAVHVAKTGGRGEVSSSQAAVEKELSLGAPRDRPLGGHFLTRGGVQVTANVQSLSFVPQGTLNAPDGSSAKAIEDLVDQLDDHKGVLFASSYEYPGRYDLYIYFIYLHHSSFYSPKTNRFHLFHIIIIIIITVMNGTSSCYF